MIAYLWRDLRYGVRTLGKHKGVTTVTVLSLSLRLVLTAMTMAVVNAYLLRALLFPAAQRLYHVNYVPQGVPEPRGPTSLLTGFALFATFVAMLGIYGVTAYIVLKTRSERWKQGF